MSSEQARRGDEQNEAIKYGEVFKNVSGELAGKAITPRDAATVQSAESQLLGGQIRKGGPAALMESAAARNERAGAVSHGQVTDLAANEGVTISEEHTDEGNRLITHTLAGQVVGQFVEANNNKGGMNIDNMDADAPATMQAPQVKADTQHHHDFIVTSTDPIPTATTTLNPRLSLSATNQHHNTLANVSTDKVGGETRTENPNAVISSVPGGMGASMATADQRLANNK